jgi:hypothetical protein
MTITQSKLTIRGRITKNIMFEKALTNARCARFSRNSPSSYIAISSSNSMIEVISGVSPFNSIQSFDAGHGGT